MLALLCFCVATEFSANKDLYKAVYAIVVVNADEVGERNAARAKIVRMNAGGRAVALFCRCIYHGHRCRGDRGRAGEGYWASAVGRFVCLYCSLG